MNSQKSFKNIFIFTTLIFLSSETILAQHGNDSTKTEMNKMDCCKNMKHSKHKMGSNGSKMNNKEKMNIEKRDMNNDGKVFIDGMCKDIVKDEPGKCPNCGMTLKEVTLEEARMFIENHNKKNSH